METVEFPDSLDDLEAFGEMVVGQAEKVEVVNELEYDALCKTFGRPIKQVWRIRTEGLPRNPYYRAFKRRTYSLIGTRQQAEEYAEQLRKYQGLKILWIKLHSETKIEKLEKRS